ncbi:MAG: SDR family NAD(P)-dependent oxidoreductase [Candidatus Nanoarchaeia archaeon]|nr:SDR family NAD(P)-dependent oxidoreductase [Candidatus Nanoarchaeia archaeon]
MKSYWNKYKLSSMFEMAKNGNKNPKECLEDFNGKLVLITGATSGIGYETAKEYASHGTNILSINRNEEKSKKLKQEIEKEFNVKCDYLIADFEKISDVIKVGKKLADSKIKIDVLIHNVGIHLTGRKLTKDNIEKVFQVNYLGSFIINYLLKEKLKKQKNCRILFVNSEGHRFAFYGVPWNDINCNKRFYWDLQSYGIAKTAQLHSMIILNDYYKNSGVTINACHPGLVKTNIGMCNGPVYRFFKKLLNDPFARHPKISAKALYYLGVCKEMKNVSAKYFSLTTLEEPAPHAWDKEAAKETWINSIKLVGLK